MIESCTTALIPSTTSARASIPGPAIIPATAIAQIHFIEIAPSVTRPAKGSSDVVRRPGTSAVRELSARLVNRSHDGRGQANGAPLRQKRGDFVRRAGNQDGLALTQCA